jgi:hypothetical protein
LPPSHGWGIWMFDLTGKVALVTGGSILTWRA